MISLAALTLLLALADTPPAPSGAYAVVGRDGVVTWLAGPPERRGALWVGKLPLGGSLVSLRVKDIDVEATRTANGPGGLVERSVARTQRGPGPTPPVLRVKRSEAEAGLAKTSGSKLKKPPDEAPAASEAEQGEGFVAKDREGRGESYWRERASKINAALARAEEEMVVARDYERRLELHGYVPNSPAWLIQWTRMKEMLANAEATEVEARRKKEELVEEARKAGAYPGWLR